MPTQVEEMLIARACLFHQHGGQLGYKGRG